MFKRKDFISYRRLHSKDDRDKVHYYRNIEESIEFTYNNSWMCVENRELLLVEVETLKQDSKKLMEAKEIIEKLCNNPIIESATLDRMKEFIQGIED